MSQASPKLWGSVLDPRSCDPGSVRACQDSCNLKHMWWNSHMGWEFQTKKTAKKPKRNKNQLWVPLTNCLFELSFRDPFVLLESSARSPSPILPKSTSPNPTPANVPEVRQPRTLEELTLLQLRPRVMKTMQVSGRPGTHWCSEMGHIQGRELDLTIMWCGNIAVHEEDWSGVVV